MLAAWATAILPGPALAQQEGLVTPPDQLPAVHRGDRTHNIDFLFGALKAAPDDTSAKAVEDRIWAMWTSAGNDTTGLLMSRAKKAIDGKNYDLALRLLDAVIEIKPAYTEAWNRRATIHYLQKDYGRALSDIREVLSREPRHFGALSGLGLILQEIGDEKHALEAYGRALAIDPHLENVEDAIKNLREKVEGREI